MIDVRDGLLTLAFPYDEKLVAEVREIRGRRWDSSAKVWTFPMTAIRPLRALAEAHGMSSSSAVDALPDLEPVGRPRVGITAGRFTVCFEYDPDLVNRVRDIPGARWNGQDRVWTIDLDSEPEVAQFVVDTDAQIETSADHHLDEARDAIAKIDASMAAAADIDIPGLAGDLLPFQRAGVTYALEALGR